MSPTPLKTVQGNSQSLHAPAITITAPHRESLVKPPGLMILPSKSYNMFPSQRANCGGSSHNRIDCGICGPGPKPSTPSPLDPISPFYFAQPNLIQGGRPPPKTQSSSQAKPKSGYPQANGQSGAKKPEPFDGWMAKFCVEPEYGYDAGGCCLAFWVPCAQYGKTHWRLKQVEDGQDPSNARWKSSDGCNGPCWAWCGLCCLLQCDCILTGLQRTRIRATYGIKGNIGNDLALSLFCRPCTMMQMDREVRAREGDQELWTNPKACPKAAPITAQPSPVQEMRYVSPRQTVSDNEPLRDCGNGTEPRDGPPTSKQLPKLPKRQPKSEKAHHPPQPDEYHLEMSNAKAREPSYDPKHDIRPLKSKPGKATSTSPPSFSHNPISPLSSKVPQDEKSTFKTLDSVLTSSFTIKAEDSTASTRILAENAKLEVVKEGAKSSEHTIVDSSRAAKKESINPTDNHELSYVHDFTECQVDQNILNYYEKEEKRSQQHTLVDCSQTDSTSPHPQAIGKLESTRTKSTSTEQHALADGAQEDVSGKDKSNKGKSTSPEQHVLANCSKEDASDRPQLSEAKSTAPEQHALVDCARESSSKVPPSTALRQHALADCHEESDSPGTPGRESRRASTPAQSPTNKHPEERQHRLASCPVPSFNQKEEKAAIAHQMAENARINESGDSQSTVKPSSQHALGDCMGDANSERKVPVVNEESQIEKLVSLGFKTDEPVKDKDVADHPRKSRYRKEVEISANLGVTKRASQAHNALSQVLAGGAQKKENSQQDHVGEVVIRVLGGNTEQEKVKGKAGSQEDHKSSGLASIFSKIASPKSKAQQ